MGRIFMAARLAVLAAASSMIGLIPALGAQIPPMLPGPAIPLEV